MRMILIVKEVEQVINQPKQSFSLSWVEKITRPKGCIAFAT